MTHDVVQNRSEEGKTWRQSSQQSISIDFPHQVHVHFTPHSETFPSSLNK